MLSQQRTLICCCASGKKDQSTSSRPKLFFFRSHHSPPTQTGPQLLAAAIHLRPVFVTEALADGQDQNFLDLKVFCKWTWMELSSNKGGAQHVIHEYSDFNMR